MHGGAVGLRDESLFDSALARPHNLLAYGTAADIADLAAAYAYGLARNHVFVDGNKRAAFMAVGLFLGINGFALATSQADATQAMLALAAGEMDETGYAAWLRQHIQTANLEK